MKLAEALLERASLQSKLSDLRTRLMQNALVQEGESPAEDPAELQAAVDAALVSLEKLILEINMTNAKTLCDGQPVTALLAKRDCMREKIALYRDFLSSASGAGSRARGSEIKILSTVPVAKLRQEIDRYAEELRLLEIKIQKINWSTDLIR